MNGTRNDQTRDVIATYVDRITVWPSEKRGEMRLNPSAYALWKRGWDGDSQPDREHIVQASPKRHDCRKGRSWVNPIGARGFEPPTS